MGDALPREPRYVKLGECPAADARIAVLAGYNGTVVASLGESANIDEVKVALRSFGKELNPGPPILLAEHIKRRGVIVHL